MVKLLSVTNDLKQSEQLRRSLHHFGWDYEFLTPNNYEGWGTKPAECYRYLKAHPEITSFFLIDSFDCFVLGTMEEALSKIGRDKNFLSAEINCWPHPEKSVLYPPSPTVFKHCCGGAYYMDSQTFISWWEEKSIPGDDNDQVWLTDMVIKYKPQLDYYCDVFQNLCGVLEPDFLVEGDRLTNKITGSSPIIFHGNGKTDMNYVYNLLR